MKDNFVQDYNTAFNLGLTHKVVFEMGEDTSDDFERVNLVMRKYQTISDYLFQNKAVHIILTSWKNRKETLFDLNGIDFKISTAKKIKFKKDYSNVVRFDNVEQNDEIIYLEYNEFNFEIVKPLIKGIAGFELALNNSLNARMYLVSFDRSPTLLNLYDDRGMELISNSPNLIQEIRQNFSDWITM